jgi:uncharacterized protein YbaR (Trm112 family)
MSGIRFKIVVCPMSHKIIVADNFPFEYNAIKCQKCKKEYKIDSKGKIMYQNGMPISKDIKEDTQQV